MLIKLFFHCIENCYFGKNEDHILMKIKKIGKIIFLVPLIVSNFNFDYPLKLFTNFVLLSYPIKQSCPQVQN